MCILGKTTVVNFSLRPTTFWAMSVWPSAYSIRDKFLPVEQPLNLIWLQLVICTTGIPLFHPWTHRSWKISSVAAYRVHCWVRSLMSCLLWKTPQHPLTPRRLASNGRVSWLSQDWLHYRSQGSFVVCSNRLWSSIFSGQPKALAIVCVTWSASKVSLIHNLKGDNCARHWDFHFIVHLWGTPLSTHARYSC